MEETRQLKQLITRWVEMAQKETAVPAPPPYIGNDITIVKLVEHTGEVCQGAGFVARVRTTSDGHRWINQAIEQGATFILAEKPAQEVGVFVPAGVVYWQVPDTSVALAYLSAAWHDFPAHKLTMIGITGTDGKTSTATMLFSVLKKAGLKTGLITTIQAIIGDEEMPTGLHVTTPEAPAVQGYLAQMVQAGLTHCILETTSIGLAQNRVGAIPFAVGIVTNIQHEHLDYHGSYENYMQAKGKLFEAAQGGTAVLNHDDTSYNYLSTIPVKLQQTYGLLAGDVTAKDIVYGAQETRFVLQTAVGSLSLCTPLVGEFNIYNMLATATTALALGIDLPTIQAGLQALEGISGRMERIHRGQEFLAMVDFAHTPNALVQAIRAARPMVSGRVITVFGSAGKRDVEKRKLMAEISAREADLTILTAEDPRTESLDGILEMMARACESQGGVEGVTFWRVPDRGQAIYHALTLAEPNDVVVACGKGHEQSMCFDTTEYDWDDRHALRTALDAFLAGQPMVDLGLPTYS